MALGSEKALLITPEIKDNNVSYMYLYLLGRSTLVSHELVSLNGKKIVFDMFLLQ